MKERCDKAKILVGVSLASGIVVGIISIVAIPVLTAAVIYDKIKGDV